MISARNLRYKDIAPRVFNSHSSFKVLLPELNKANGYEKYTLVIDENNPELHSVYRLNAKWEEKPELVKQFHIKQQDRIYNLKFELLKELKSLKPQDKINLCI